MKIFEITKPQNVVEPEEPQDQQPAAQAAPAPQAPAEPQRKPRYKWQPGPSSADFGAPDINIPNPETGKLDYNPAWADWRKSEKGAEYSTASKAHYDAQLKAMHQHAGVNPKDFDTTIDEVPNPYFKADGPEDEDDPNFEPELISVGVDYDYNYHGKHYPATYYEPEEFPELEITINRVVDLDNGEDITKKVDLSAIEKYIEDEIPSWEEAERDARDQAAIDRYEANRDDYYESINSIKRLSGL